MDSGISSAGNGLQAGAAGAAGVAKPSPPAPVTPLTPEEHHRALDELLNDMLLTVENIPDLPAAGASHRHRSHVVTLDELPPPPHFSHSSSASSYSRASERGGCQSSACWQYASPPLQPPSAAATAAAASPPASDVTSRPAAAAAAPAAAASPPAAFSSSPQSLNGYHSAQSPPRALDVLGVHRYIDEGATTSSSEATAADENIPYHARQDSRPFTYGAIPSGPGMLQMHTGLASPSLVRKASFRSAGSTGSPSSAAATPGTPRQSPAITNITSITSITKASPPPPADFSDSAPGDAGSPSRGDYRFSNGSSSTSPRSPEFHDGTVVGSVGGLTWLQRQQQKLRERREGALRQERRPHEVRLLSELRAMQGPSAAPAAALASPPHHLHHTLNHYHHHHHHSHSASHRADGYTSDTTHFADDDDEGDFSTPLHINTSSSPTHKLGSAGSAPASPLLPHRTSSRRFYATTERQQASYITNGSSPLNHQKGSSPGERPFVAVKRAHEQARKYDSQNGPPSPREILASQPLGFALSHRHNPCAQQTSPSADNAMLLTMVDGQQPRPAGRGVVGTSPHDDPLACLMASLAATSSCNTNSSTNAWQPQMRDDSFSSWRTASASDDHGSPPRSTSPRPQTPAFPVHPRTPYVNSSSQQFDVSQTTTTTTTGLPPKSPTTQRKDRSPSPVSDPSPVQPHQNTSMISNSSSGASSSRTMAYPTTPHSSASLSDVYLQQSPKSPAVLNGSTGQSSPTVYYGHSRRSSVHSNSEPPQEVSPAHVKFVRDTSRFWYKPTISREEAINMLRDQPPGTFVVRDSNSFPGAFGLALKVATPPPTVQGKIANINDPGSELVRHFLIEPTSRGVRLKGCANEPVFSSLSALVYQHSLIPMALPCRLLLPEADGTRLPADSPGNVSTAQMLLAQGAACNVLYLFTLDTESLTGPQAIKKAVGQLFMLRPLPTATIVHFKVSGQGITLTDNKRQLFFRRHYPVNTISYCGLDPDDHRWSQKSEETGMPISSNRVFGFVARKQVSKTDNQCHIFAELEPEQPASAIVNFVSKVMMSGGTMKANIV